jgi:hypothetical protein
VIALKEKEELIKTEREKLVAQYKEFQEILNRLDIYKKELEKTLKNQEIE